MKLLFIFTGGTIGSTFDGDYISTDKSKPYKLIDAYKKKFGIDFDFDITEPYTELSENNTGKIISILCKCAKDNSNKNYDGLIITHGTDTLQYSAAALGYALGNGSIPICIVSSNKPIEDKNANGLENLHGAIKFIEQRNPKGVWVIYKNPNDNVKIHRGTRLIASQPYSDCFYSVCDSFYGELDSNFKFIPNKNYNEKGDETEIFSDFNLDNECSEILRLEPYPGMIYPKINDKIKYIIHGTYHSGTINTKSEYVQNFFETAKIQGVKIYLSGICNGKSYSSTKAYKNSRLIPLPIASPISMYIKLWLCIKANKNPDDILFKSLGGDIFDKD